MSERYENKHPGAEEDPAISALYRRSRDSEPPAELDHAVLAEAQRVARRRPRRWLLPLSTAAVVVVGVTLVLKMGMQPQFSPQPAGVPHEPPGPVSAPEQRQPTPVAPPARDSRAEEALSPPLKSASPPPRPTAKRRTEGLESLSEPAQSDRMRFKAPAAPAVQSKAAGAPAAEERESLNVQDAPTPELWLKQIEELLTSGRQSEAKAQLAAFRRRYPDRSIPKELTPLMED